MLAALPAAASAQTILNEGFETTSTDQYSPNFPDGWSTSTPTRETTTGIGGTYTIMKRYDDRHPLRVGRQPDVYRR